MYGIGQIAENSEEMLRLTEKTSALTSTGEGFIRSCCGSNGSNSTNSGQKLVHSIQIIKRPFQ